MAIVGPVEPKPEVAIVAMHTYAQTFPQLLNQARPVLTAAELERTVAAYAAAMRLFSGAFRASGKTFLAHTIGTGSIALRHGGTADQMAAGLLHAAYTHGDFGWRWPGDPANRQWLRTRVSQPIEDLVHRYAQLRWNAKSIQSIAAEGPGHHGGDVLFLRLANELEEHLDLGLVYCGEAKKGPYQERQQAILKICRSLGHEALAGELEAAFDEIERADVPAAICNPTGQPATAFLPSASFERTWFAAGARLLRQLRRRMA